MKIIDIMEIGGFSVGHAQNDEAATGCTVVLFDSLSPMSVDVRGGGPASRETQLLQPLAVSPGANAVLLSGGSAFGLDAAGGVMRYLEEREIGVRTRSGVVPLVCESCIFDLGVGDRHVRPDAAMAYAACEAAGRQSPRQGNAGVGAGCTLGKLHGTLSAMKSGFGTYAIDVDGVKVGAMVAVNCFGDVYGEDGRIMAGALDGDGAFCNTLSCMLHGDVSKPHDYSGNTTIGIVITNAAFAKAELTKIAGMTHNGYARAIRPVHTTMDGDSIYAASTGNVPASVDLVGTMAAYVMERAVREAVKNARGAYGLKAYADLKK